MSCDDVLERVAGLLDGGLAPSDRAAVLAHLETCAECRGLHAALAAAENAPEDPRLSQAILARTSGGACESARRNLPARLDGELDVVEAELVSGHLRSCPDCAGLARALERVQEDLPLLATADPGPRFVEQVLARTSRRVRRQPLEARIAAAISRWLERPRIAWEGAFVATVVLVMPVLAPGAPLADLPSQALDRVRESSAMHDVSLVPLRGAVGEVESTLVARMRTAWAATGAAVAHDSMAAASNVARNCATAWEGIRRSLGTFPDAAASGKTDGAAADDDRAPDATQEKKR